jgi:diacylglycerol kinase family enzyme
MRDPQVRRAAATELQVVLTRRDGQAPEIIETASGAESRQLAEDAVGRGLAAVIGVGGDGTLRELAAALADTSVPLGIVPAGTGNQVAAVLGVPLSVGDAVAALATERRRSVDLGEAHLRLTSGDVISTFVLGCGAGLDARLMATTSAASKRRYGKTAYFAQGIRLAMQVGVTPVRLGVDGASIETEASLALVGNMGHLIPGVIGLRLPLDPSDGLLDLIVVASRGPIQGLKGLFDQLTRTALGGETGAESIRLRGRHITIEAESPEPIQVDGDFVGTGSLDARVRPAALDVLLPAGA